MKRIWPLFAFLAGLLPLPASGAGGPSTRPATFTIPGTVVQFTMVRIPGGELDIKAGDQLKHEKFKDFWIGRTELTWDEYDVWRNCLDLPTPAQQIAVIGVSRPSKPFGDPTLGFGHDGLPAIHITSHSAKMYCEWLSTKLGRTFRLPTEAEWEWACRAGDAAHPAQPLSAEALSQLAWFKDNSENDVGENAPRAAASKAPNAWGLYDMLGNVNEWVQGADGQYVVKGGSFRDSAKLTQSTSRQPYMRKWQDRDCQDPKSRWWLSDGPHVGFRLVMEDAGAMTKSE